MLTTRKRLGRFVDNGIVPAMIAHAHGCRTLTTLTGSRERPVGVGLLIGRCITALL